ncbi:DUF5063 domain-containing protein [Marinilabiliaceae bacterium ANBcel2]|nr:DUF5063 domain-containing protein [Marinilabiliaceae bacterium ANBcel2]
MEDSFVHPVYSPNVLEFVTVGKEFCSWLESVEVVERELFVDKALKILPLLYLKATMLPKCETVLKDPVEKFVDEEHYEAVRNRVLLIMGRFDDYLEVFTADMQRSDLPLTSTVSENLADIYQDIADFLMNYRTAVTEIMNDALVELTDNFTTYWGQRVVNVLRALHEAYYGDDDITVPDDEAGVDDIDLLNEEENSKKRDTSHWLISKMQHNYRKKE